MLGQSQNKNYMTNILTGRIVLLLERRIVISPVLKGDINPKGKGEEIISHLSQVYRERHFKKYISLFSHRHSGYVKSDKLYDVRPLDHFVFNNRIDFKEVNYEIAFGVHWLYIKNLTGKLIEVRFKDKKQANFLNHETLASCKGKAYTYPEKKIVKSKDTIIKIVLIEKIY